MSHLPARMRNRWLSRTELEPDRGAVYWHILMHPYPQACAAAIDAQDILARFAGLHMTPHRWLHVTTLMAGSTDEITRDQMSAMVLEAQRLLRNLAPIPVTLGKVHYHSEAIMLRVQPVEALLPILHAAQTSTRNVVGHDGVVDESSPSWMPHMTVSYSTTDKPTGPIFSALGQSVQKREIFVDSLSLVVQWGPERHWDWEPIGTAHLQG
jgi:2'-5' RNA ligase